MRKMIFFTLILIIGIMISNPAMACDPPCPPCYGGDCNTYLCGDCQYCNGGTCTYAAVNTLTASPQDNWCVGDFGNVVSTSSPVGYGNCTVWSSDGYGEAFGDWYIVNFTTAGEHVVKACISTDSSTGCTSIPITVVGVGSVTANKTSCCIDDPDGILFTAVSNPAGKEMRCIHWQYRYRADPNDSWSWTGGGGWGDTTSRLSSAGWHGTGYYQYRAINGVEDCNQACAESPVVKVVPLVSRIEIEYQYNNWSDVTEQSITLLKGTKYTFRAVPIGQWIEGLPTWTGVGSGSGETIEITFADVGDFTLTATAADCGNKKVDIKVVKPVVYQISFNGDNALYWGPDAPNGPNEPNLVWCDGIEAISDPVYDAEQSKINPKNDPFCVTKSSSSLVAGVVLKLPESLSFPTSIYIDAAGTEEWQEQFASFGFGGISVSADLPVDPNVVNTVKVYNNNFNMAWKYKVPLGTDEWYDIEMTKHTACVTWGTPSPADASVTVKRIDFLCDAANDASEEEVVADGIHSKLTGLPFGSDPVQSDDWDLKGGGAYRGECDEHARFMIRALELIGIQGAVPSFIYASSDSDCLSLEGRPYNGRTKWLVMDFDSSSGYSWNAFEGVCFFGAYYAVTPNVKASSSVEMLRTMSPQQYWVLTYRDIPPGDPTGSERWNVQSVLEQQDLP